YVSYNTLPGWRLRGMVREMMVHHTRRLRTGAARATEARQFMTFLKDFAANPANNPLAGPDNSYASYIRAEARSLEQHDDAYLVGTFHRQSVIVKEGVPVTEEPRLDSVWLRGVVPPPANEPAVAPDAPQKFQSRQGVAISVKDRLMKSILSQLGRAFPGALSV